MRSDDPIPPMPMASHMVQVVLDGIQQRFERHYEDEAGQFLLWTLLHPLPDGSPPANFGAAASRLQDRDSLNREIRAITEETGAAYHRLGMRVQSSSLNYKLFDVVVGMAMAALDDYIARPSVRTFSAMIQLDADQQEALQDALSYYHESE
ncbi:hypothetical protein P7D22_11565 [Lichenihabitans sp. Uapishka_5]|uniref:hypothetical protein n=1 Tax=Lichenihabitans sp. Uapishka_5 TaxID=3037302 RepID=UPI0029E82A29|nr:hypothetical protein [Lichenihabitans sp. Uapishka_5]MDX7951807.1 hypothetical protein [Lichenihabitans sp. Uapishka_5]